MSNNQVPQNRTVKLGTHRPLEVDLYDALAVVVAFGWQTVNGGLVSASNPYKFAWHSYDTVLRGYPDLIEAAVFASTGLNSDMGAREILNVLAAHRDRTIPLLDTSVPFWKMERTKLVTDPRDESPEGKLWAFYNAFKGSRVNGVKVGGIDGAGTAAYSKTGHHAFPAQMPLVDSVVLKFWSGKKLWEELWGQLQEYEDWFVELERLVEVYRQKHQNGDGVSINRLRAVDILIWVKGSGQWDESLEAGRRLLDVGEPLTDW